MDKIKIKANELRVGNYHESSDFRHPRLGIYSVLIDGKAFGKISSYGIHLVDIGEMTFEPIPLTPEWLIKLGFEDKSSKDCWIFHKNFIPCSRITIAGLKKYGNEFSLYEIQGCDNDGEFSEPDISADDIKSNRKYNHIVSIDNIKFVHNLQNIYFALSDEELSLQEQIIKPI